MSGHNPPLRRSFALALSIAFALSVPRAAFAAPDPPPSAASLAEAKKLFERGLKLYKEKAFREALALFIRANELSPRASIQKNIAQCNRDLQEFAAAYDAYGDLLDKYGATLSAAETTTIKSVIAELALLTGAIRVTVAEPGASVRIDGRDVGTTPLAKPIRVKLERHHVEIAKQGFDTLTKDVDIAAGATATIDGPLETETKTGHVSVTLKGAGDAHVFVDGEDVGVGPSWEGDVTPGTHAIEARGMAVMAPIVRVDVARRARVPVSLELRARLGHVQVDSHTIDAEIAIDGVVVGKGAWAGDLPVGRRELSITLKGFETHRAAIIVSETQVVDDVHLVPIGGAPGGGPSYVGIYSSLDFFGVASPGDATNGIAQSCPSQPCNASSPLGAGLGVRVGYSFGWFGVEGLALGMYDTSTADVTYANELTTGPNIGIPRSESYRFHRYGGGGAVGGRFTTKHPNVRFTFGAALGVEYKGMIYKRDAVATNVANATSSFTSSATTYTAPMIVLDLGLLLGGATGPKFHIGALAMFEMVGDPVFANGDDTKTLGTTKQKLGTPALQMASGTQFFIGPVVGLHFGE